MDREKLQSFITAAEADIASVRRSLLIAAQTGDISGLPSTLRILVRIGGGAEDTGQAKVATLVAQCSGAVTKLVAGGKCSPHQAYTALDLVIDIEASLFAIPVAGESPFPDVAGFVDASFDVLVPRILESEASPPDIEAFEIDEETLDIFREEADELLSRIDASLISLSVSPGNQNALWEIRRAAHTFKGAAGIVGLTIASEIAHRMEDLLDKMVETRREATPQVIDFLTAATGNLNLVVSAKNIDELAPTDESFEQVMQWLSSPPVENSPANRSPCIATSANLSHAEAPKSTTTPIVRVSLERLDELIKLSNSLLFNRSALAERFDELAAASVLDAESVDRFQSLFKTQRHLTDEIQTKLKKIRMVKFGTLETRLSRAINVTCQDENKKAYLEIENGEVEIDTQMIDALIEPLLHLLKNAVVHGIEPPDTRRLIGKPERGKIRVHLEANSQSLKLSVSDDGGGISIPQLLRKAVESGLITTDAAARMGDAEAIKLIFDRGLTTAKKLDLNSGRGVGMSIVKESVENMGGSVLVETKPQTGSTFKILMPLASRNSEPTQSEISAVSSDNFLPPLVLVVDDSPVIRHQTTKLFKNAGYRAITAHNGAEALELLLNGEWEPDIILSDVEMPQIDGWEFLEYIKTDTNFRHIPVIMVTSLDTDTDRTRAFSLGASDYIVKPFGESDVERVAGKITEMIKA